MTGPDRELTSQLTAGDADELVRLVDALSTAALERGRALAGGDEQARDDAHAVWLPALEAVLDAVRGLEVDPGRDRLVAPGRPAPVEAGRPLPQDARLDGRRPMNADREDGRPLPGPIEELPLSAVTTIEAVEMLRVAVRHVGPVGGFDREALRWLAGRDTRVTVAVASLLDRAWRQGVAVGRAATVLTPGEVRQLLGLFSAAVAASYTAGKVLGTDYATWQAANDAAGHTHSQVLAAVQDLLQPAGVDRYRVWKQGVAVDRTELANLAEVVEGPAARREAAADTTTTDTARAEDGESCEACRARPAYRIPLKAQYAVARADVLLCGSCLKAVERRRNGRLAARDDAAGGVR